MAKFRDLSGSFFSIPEEVLEKYRILPEDLSTRLKNEQVSGTEIGESGLSAGTGRGFSAPRVIVNQFFTPVKAPDMQGGTDFAAQYTFPAAWGGQK